MPITFKVSDKYPEPVEVYQPTIFGRSQINGATPLKETPWNSNITQGAGNGFVDGVVQAYNQHHKLVLRPDDVWLAIAVQFGFFVNGAAETLRNTIVNHTGQKELVVKADGTIETAPYADLLAENMVQELRENVKDPALCDWILPAFSTTTVNDRIVGSVVLMATLKSYFSYKMVLRCGIPEVTLQGTPEDWEIIHHRIGRLRSFGTFCNEWADMLDVITMNLVRTARGDIPVEFWQRICHHHQGGSGPTYLSGWLTAFCVFTRAGKWQGHMKKVTKRGEMITTSFPSSQSPDIEVPFPVIDFSCVPPGYVTVPMLIDDNGKDIKTLLYAGHGAYMADPEDTVNPLLSWAIVGVEPST